MGKPYTTEKARWQWREGENDPIGTQTSQKIPLKRIKSAQDAKKAQAAKEEQNRTLAEEFWKSTATLSLAPFQIKQHLL